MTEEMTITYAGVTCGSSTARRISDYTRDEQDYTNAYFEFEIVTTAATDAAFVAELATLRAAFRNPRQDLVVTQNGETYLSRKHSDNTALNTFPRILKDGDPADTGRSHHFRVRIEYELPADNVGTDFRRGATVNVQYTAAGRRTVTISGIYTANSTDGTTTALAQYGLKVAAFESTELDLIDSSVDWEQVGKPQVEFFETNKLLSWTTVYRDVPIDQANGTTDDADIFDPHLEITVEQIAADDSLEAGLSFVRGGGAGGGQTQAGPRGGGGEATGGGLSVRKPIIITAVYDAAISIANVEDLQIKWQTTIRPWIRIRAGAYNPSGFLVQIGEAPAYEDYEHHIRGSVTFLSFSGSIIKQKISYRDITADGKILIPSTESDPFAFYEYQGPAVRQLTVTEEREELVGAGVTARQYVLSAYAGIGGIASVLGEDWVKVSRTPQAHILTRGFHNGDKQPVAYSTVESVFQFRHRKKPSKANAGGVTGSTVT